MIDIIEKACDDSFEKHMNGEKCSNFTSDREDNVISLCFEVGSEYGIHDDNVIHIDLDSEEINCYLTERYEGSGIEDEIEKIVKSNIVEIKKNLVNIKKYTITITSENEDNIPSSEDLRKAFVTVNPLGTFKIDIEE